MSGLPALVVKLDDGTGTFPYDISSYVRLADGYTLTPGRADEFGDVQPTMLSISLENTDGRFTYGSGTYNCSVDQMIQVSLDAGAGLVKRFTGYVQNWPVAWPDGSDQYAVAAITATDRLARLSRHKLKSMLEHEILLDSPAAVYTLEEAAGSTTAGDTSGNGVAALTPYFVTTPAVEFGVATGLPADNKTGATFAASGEQLAGGLAAATYAGASMEAFFSIDSPPALISFFATDFDGATGLGLGVTSAGFAIVRGGNTATGAVNVCDGTTHHMAVTWDGTTLRLYVDGTFITSTATAGTPRLGPIALGGVSVPVTLSRVAMYPTALSAARILAHASGGLNGFNTERSDQRIARLAGYAGIPAGAMSLDAGAQQHVPAQETNGASATEAMNTVAESEGGLLFIGGDGNLVMQNRYHRSLETAAVLTLAAIDIEPDTIVTVDPQKLINYAEVTSAGTGAKQTVQNGASVAAHGQYPTTLSPLVATDAEGLDRANWVVTTQSTPQPRVGAVKVDLLTASSALQQAALAMQLSDRFKVTGMPSQTPGGSTLDLIVEGWTETYNLTTWELALNSSNWEVERGWILGDATYSQLGISTRLSY